ncbi:MAG: hypothetical protein KF716_21410 [Anaerolineae bacterium]|nr:hypothetical protein [Anaerolineae bacterium]
MFSYYEVIHRHIVHYAQVAEQLERDSTSADFEVRYWLDRDQFALANKRVMQRLESYIGEPQLLTKTFSITTYRLYNLAFNILTVSSAKHTIASLLQKIGGVAPE